MVGTDCADFVVPDSIKFLRFWERFGIMRDTREVAQPGRALRSGRRGRRFESDPPDH